MTPLFSIIIPVYNRAAAVQLCLESVRQQTIRNFECLVIDDGSDDGATLELVVRGLADSRFIYMRRENGGGGAARNTGVDAATGAYVAFLDSDDAFVPRKLERVAAHLDGDPLRAWYSKVAVNRGGQRRWVRPSRGIRAGEDVAEYLFFSNQIISTITIVLATETARLVRFDPDLRKGQDLDFCVRLARHGVHFTMIPEPLAIWNDVTEIGRTSRTRGARQPTEWLHHNAHRLSRRAVAGYKANVLAYYVAEEQPLLALRYLGAGLLGGVRLRTIARQALRAFLPRTAYRSLVDWFVATFASRPNS